MKSVPSMFCCWLVLVCLGFLAGGSVCSAQKSKAAASRDDFVSDASFIVGTYDPSAADHSVDSIVKLADRFLESLNEEQKSKCLGELASEKRREWTNLPARNDADGVKFSELSKEQIEKACALMGSLLSRQGFEKMRSIMLADDQLLREGKPRRGFGTENFAIVIFGTPSSAKPWCFQLDGHHVGANISIQGREMTMSPSFIGTQPKAFTIGGVEYRPFKNETEMAHQLAMSLSDEQVKKAVVQPKRARIVAGPGRDNFVPVPQGLPCEQLSEKQQEVLIKLIEQWVGDLPPKQSKKRMKEIRSELSQMSFAWNGNRNPKSDISYRIQSPSLIIEYACQDLGGDPLDHLHSNYRDPTNDYGGQLKQ